MNRPDGRQLAVSVALATAALGVASLVVAALQGQIGIPNASSVYLVAVVLVAFVSGTIGAVLASVASFLLYDFLFVEPIGTFTVADPLEWLNLFLLLFVGIVVGQLAALQRSRAEMARAREREARGLFSLSRALATRRSTTESLSEIAEILRSQARMSRTWIALGGDDAAERVSADTGGVARPPAYSRHQVLRRMPGDLPAEWVRVQQPTRASAAQGTEDAYRIRLEGGGETLGSIWAVRDRRYGMPDRTETRLLAAAADQIGQVLAQDRLAADARAADVARASDALKSALLQSVSHDLRTPLATIRAAAGTLRPGSSLSDADRMESATAIDREVQYLDRLVTNLLDLSRIEAGTLFADRDVFELDDLLGRTLDRLRPRLAERPIQVDASAPPVDVDPIFFDEAVTNILENALKYTSPGTELRISATELDDGFVRLTVEDAGPGVPAGSLPKLFDKFYRVPGTAKRSRSGTGIGLAVVRGLVEAMGGRVSARPSALGGLAIDLDLQPARSPAGVEQGSAT